MTFGVRLLFIYLAMLDSEEDRHEFLELYNLYSNSMLLVARKIFGQDYNAAEDAVQNAWMKFFKNSSRSM